MHSDIPRDSLRTYMTIINYFVATNNFNKKKKDIKPINVVVLDGNYLRDRYLDTGQQYCTKK